MFGIWFILAITVVIVIYFVLKRRFNEDVAYIAVSIVPLTSLLLTIAFGSIFNRVLGDWGTMELVVGLLAMSPVLGLIGVVLVVNGFRRRKYRIGLLVATALAYVPLIILVFPRGK
jgi:hypothetical protein